MNLHVEAQVRTALGALPAATAAPAAAHAEQVFEDIGEGMGEISAEALPAAHAALLEGGMAETVIGGALVAVLEHVVGLVELFELVFALVIARIAVRVMLHGELAERGLEVGVAGLARNTQDFVISRLDMPGPPQILNAVIAVLDSAILA